MAKRRRPHRVPPPTADALVRWPDDLGTRFLLTVDVEEEFAWRAPLDRRPRVTTVMEASPDVYGRFGQAGAPIRCLVGDPIACEPWSVGPLRANAVDGRSETGTQLRAWLDPSHGEGTDQQDIHRGDLPSAPKAAKLDRLTGMVAAAFDQASRTYRPVGGGRLHGAPYRIPGGRAAASLDEVTAAMERRTARIGGAP